jgi:5'-nucleotidase/UDP-sugar diphosphatase
MVTSATIKGAPVDKAKTYRLVVNNFQAAGGDGYPKMTGHPSFANSGFVDADVLRAYIAAKSPLKAADFDASSTVERQ